MSMDWAAARRVSYLVEQSFRYDYPAPIRDLLMWLALTGLFRARWTNQIHEEWMRSVLADRGDSRGSNWNEPATS